MTDLNETDSNTNNEIETATDNKLENNTAGDTNIDNSNIDNSTANESSNNIDNTGEISISDAKPDVEITTEANAATVDKDEESSKGNDSEGEDANIETTTSTEANANKSNKDDHKESYDVVYEGEMTIPMDVDKLIVGVIAKHNHYLNKYQAEFDTLDPVLCEIIPKLEAAKKSRDEINERVAVLKEKRSQLYHQAKEMRTEMYKLMDIDNDLKSAPIESKKIRDTIEELDWMLQTTQMTTSKERGVVKEIRILDAKLHTMDNDVDREAEVSAKISELKEKIHTVMDGANEAHEGIVAIVDESQKFHEEYVKYNEMARGSGGRHKWLNARITSHKEALEYWNKKAAGDVSND